MKEFTPMKYSRFLSAVIFILATNVYAYQPKIEIIEQFDKLRIIAFLSEGDIANSPKWNPNLEAPALSIVEAIQAVKTFTKVSQIDVKEIEIRPLSSDELYWHYLIKVANNEMTLKYSVYVVLMSGKVISAIIEPEGYK